MAVQNFRQKNEILEQEYLSVSCQFLLLKRRQGSENGNLGSPLLLCLESSHPAVLDCAGKTAKRVTVRSDLHGPPAQSCQPVVHVVKARRIHRNSRSDKKTVLSYSLFTLAGIFLAASGKIRTWLIWCFSAEKSHTQSQWHLCEGLQVYSHLPEQIMQFLAAARKIPASVNTPLCGNTCSESRCLGQPPGPLPRIRACYTEN